MYQQPNGSHKILIQFGKLLATRYTDMTKIRIHVNVSVSALLNISWRKKFSSEK